MKLVRKHVYYQKYSSIAQFIFYNVFCKHWESAQGIG